VDVHGKEFGEREIWKKTHDVGHVLFAFREGYSGVAERVSLGGEKWTGKGKSHLNEGRERGRLMRDKRREKICR